MPEKNLVKEFEASLQVFADFMSFVGVMSDKMKLKECNFPFRHVFQRFWVKIEPKVDYRIRRVRMSGTIVDGRP